MRNRQCLAWVLTGALFWGVCTVSGAEAAGPWKGQIVDAETGQPLEGVVVLMYWTTYTASFGGWAGGEFYDAEEAVTGPDGRLVIQARSIFTLVPWKKISRDLVIFKPGYGQWRFQGSQNWPQDVYEHMALAKKAWEQFSGEGVAIELPPLKTREERLKFNGILRWSGLVPAERTKRLEEAMKMERAYLGFGD